MSPPDSKAAEAVPGAAPVAVAPVAAPVAMPGAPSGERKAKVWEPRKVRQGGSSGRVGEKFRPSQ